MTKYDNQVKKIIDDLKAENDRKDQHIATLEQAIEEAIWNMEVDCGASLSERVRLDLKKALEEAKPEGSK